MKVKICVNNKSLEISRLPHTFKNFTLNIFTNLYTELPKNWRLEYIDDGDKISLRNDKDYEAFKDFVSQDPDSEVQVNIITAENVNADIPQKVEDEIILEKAKSIIEDDYEIIDDAETKLQNKEDNFEFDEIISADPVDNSVVVKKQKVEEKKDDKKKAEQVYLGQRERYENKSIDPAGLQFSYIKVDCKESEILGSENKMVNKPVDALPKKKYQEKLEKLQKCFPNVGIETLCQFVENAPEDMTLEELVENLKH